MRSIKLLIMGAIALLSLSACSKEPVSERPAIYTSFPNQINPECRHGEAKLFDECGDQVQLFNNALLQANKDGKVLLVEVGAEWCIWCHVFTAHINGNSRRFRYTYGSPEQPDARDTDEVTEDADPDIKMADALRDYVAKHFVIVRIDIQYAPQGYDVMKISGAMDSYPNAVPFIYTVNSKGKFVGALNQDILEKRREGVNWYRGYNRIALLNQLTALHEASGAPKGP